MIRRVNLRTLATLLCLLAGVAHGQQASLVRYLGNEGVMVTHGSTKVLFDPLFNESFGQYQLVPEPVRAAIFAGEPPYDGINAVLVSHFHDDHFSPADLLRLLRAHMETRLYAPAQAVAAVRALAGAGDEGALSRITGLDLDYGDPPVSIDAGALLIEAVHVPHSGWPTRRTDVQNLAFRVTLDGTATVLHLGDADPRRVHFTTQESYWEARSIDLALPPYWFFASADGVGIIEEQLDIDTAIGIHVPDAFADPGNIPPALQDSDLFTHPGEERSF